MISNTNKQNNRKVNSLGAERAGAGPAALRIILNVRNAASLNNQTLLLRLGNCHLRLMLQF